MKAPSGDRGFSLLEMLVALVILSISLGMLYQAVAGATRSVRIDRDYNHAVILAESVLANYQVLPAGGVQDEGEAEGYRWSVQSEPLDEDIETAAYLGLYQLDVVVTWGDPGGRQVALTTIVPSLEDENAF